MKEFENLLKELRRGQAEYGNVEICGRIPTCLACWVASREAEKELHPYAKKSRKRKR